MRGNDGQTEDITSSNPAQEASKRPGQARPAQADNHA